MADDRPSLAFGSADALRAATHRRGFLKCLALGGTVVLLPGMLAGCSDDSVVGPGSGPAPGSGNAVTIDFARGDIAVLQFAYALEQLEADFYTRVVQSFDASDLTAADKAVLLDIKYHEVLHRDWFRQVLGADGNFTLTPTYPGVDFRSRASVLAAAQQFEFLGVAAYNGAAQYLANVDFLLQAGKIVSVEARHASAIADLIAPRTMAFAPRAFENATRPATVGAAAQGFLVDRVQLANAPSTFVQGPNGNG